MADITDQEVLDIAHEKATDLIGEYNAVIAVAIASITLAELIINMNTFPGKRMAACGDTLEIVKSLVEKAIANGDVTP